MMTGLLLSKGVKVGEEKVGKSLKRLDPVSNQGRAETAGRSLNPKCYSADYFGHKIHLDQNEKLGMFGVTHVMARDGYSGMIVAFSTMPIKNNLVIYEEVYEYFTKKYGLWDQVRVDGGKEFYLVCHVQELMRNQRRNTAIDPFKSTKSTDNNIIERMWVEVNSRVNYPLKDVINQFIRNGEIEFSSVTTKCAVSWVLCRVSKVGIERFVAAWNHHSIPKKGRPIALMQRNNKSVHIDNLMRKEEAVYHYVNLCGGQLTSTSSFGKDPLDGHPHLIAQREAEILKKVTFENIFSTIQQGHTKQLLYCIQLFLRISNALLIAHV